jgi:hypothetical protein
LSIAHGIWKPEAQAKVFGDTPGYGDDLVGISCHNSGSAFGPFESLSCRRLHSGTNGFRTSHEQPAPKAAGSPDLRLPYESIACHALVHSTHLARRPDRFIANQDFWRQCPAAIADGKAVD